MVKRGKKPILCDTNVILAYFKANQQMYKELDFLGFDRLHISTITVGEIYYNIRKGEKRQTREIINQFKVQPLTAEISALFEELMYKHHKNHPSIPDCLIAATALVNNAELFTFNTRHFDYYEDITFYKPKYQH